MSAGGSQAQTAIKQQKARNCLNGDDASKRGSAVKRGKEEGRKMSGRKMVDLGNGVHVSDDSFFCPRCFCHFVAEHEGG